MIEKVQERSPVSCILVRVSTALDPIKMALLESESEQSLFDKIVDIMYIVRNVLLQNREIALRNNLMTFFKRLLNLTS